MDLTEVTNPHFALPVVVVVLLAVLVFAFGFKSPAPPPVFDFEDAKKPQQQKVKKRKTKETQKGKPQQNGHVLGVVKNSQDATKGGKAKTVKEKERVTENGAKPEKETKSKKKKQPRDGLDLLGLDESLISHVEENDAGDAGEWVHLPTKKEKKNRKKEELSGAQMNQDGDRSATDEMSNQHKSGTELSSESQQSTPLKKSKKAKSKSKVKSKAEDQAEPVVATAVVTEESKPVEEAEAKPQRQGKDKKAKKEKAEDVSPNTDVPAAVVESVCTEEAKESEVLAPATEGTGSAAKYDDDSLMEIQTSKPTANNEAGNKAKKKSKKGGKGQANLPSEEPSSAGAKEQEKPMKSTDNDAHPEPASKFEPPSSITTDKDTIHSVTEKEENKENVGGSNVVFDELGDMWQDSKSQKKKRKARRDQ